jgi:predicted enzyme related to lactoylglutathione lyase
MPVGTSLRLLNILYTNHMSESVAFYERLGLFRREDGDVNQWWNEFQLGDATLALHWNRDEPLPTESNPELHLQANRAEFEAIYRDMADHQPSEMQTLERMGRFFTVVDPNGVQVQVNEQAR